MPFEGLETHEIYQLICHESSRPKIPVETPEALQTLIRACWQQDFRKRPKLDQIIDILREEIE